MKKTILIIVAVVAAALIFLGIMLATDKDKPLDNPATDAPVVTEPPIDIMFYEDYPKEGEINTSTAPSKAVKITEGKVVYKDGTEKTWLEIYKEQSTTPEDRKLFTFVGGTTLLTAFNDNEDIVSVIIPEGIRELESCFNNNFTACDVTLPASLETISHSFENAQDLTLSANEGGKMTVINNVLYTDQGKTLLMYPDWKNDSEYVMPDDVTTIAQDAITDNPYLTKIVLSKDLENIDIHGISNCANVVEVTMPVTLKSIHSAFTGMPMLETLEIPDGALLSGVNFTKCPKLQLVVHDTNTNYTYEDGVLYNKDKTVLIRYMESKTDTEFATPDSITELSPSAFAYNEYVETISINEGVTTVGTFFAECKALTTVNLPVSMTSLKTMTFTRLPKLTSINFAGTMLEWMQVNKGIDWIISSLEYKLNCSDESISYKGTA